MFCLLADVQMRRRSDRRVGLQHALRGVLAAGGNYGVRWPIECIVAAADAAVGRTTLVQLYALMKDCPRAVDLATMWDDLGVRRGEGNEVTPCDEAPLAEVRRAILG